MEYKKISVLVVTYNQAEVIGRNLESILQQKEHGLHEIIICDDCSSDNNWEIIQDYAERYPNIIRAHRNHTNLGIYGNSDNCVLKRGDADLFCWLEGDDALEPNFFKAVQHFIISNKIDTNDAIGIFCDYSSIDPSNKKIIHPNNLILSGIDPLSLFIRGLVSWRASVFSNKVLTQFSPTILDKGLALAELLFDSQWFRYLKQSYYCPIPGSIYYTEIGVSLYLGYQSTYKKDQAVIKWKYFLQNEYINSKKDFNWLMFKKIQAEHFKSPSIIKIITAFYYYFKSMKGFSDNNFSFFKSNFYPMIKFSIYSK